MSEKKTISLSEYFESLNQLKESVDQFSWGKLEWKNYNLKQERQREKEVLNELEKKKFLIKKQSLQNEIRSLSQVNNDIPKSTLEDPFRDLETQKLFYYIIKNWKNKTPIKYSYIWNFLNSSGNYISDPKCNLHNEHSFKGGIKYINDYKELLGTNFQYFQSIQPEKATSSKRYDELIKLYEDFCKTYV
jgi:hypothetical protein